MSTRCQVHVKQAGLSWNAEIMLYHHCDGYPSNMIPLIYKAFQMAMAPHDYGSFKATNWDMAGRTGTVGAWLCAADPRGFAVESGLALHGDIEYLYEIELVNTHGGCIDEKPVWIVSYRDTYEDGQPVIKGEISELAKKFEVPA